jgi:biofilm PGA synthesis N-glycosyltransferase PgaC
MAVTLHIILSIYCLMLIAFLLGWLNVRRRQMPNRRPDGIRMSLVIAIRNEEENLQNLVRELAGIAYPPDRFEVILVNDHSTDGSADLLKELVVNIPTVRILHLPDGAEGKKRALLLGISQSRFDVIVTTDADCLFSKHWLSCIASYFDNAEVKMLVGGVKLTNDNSFFFRLQATEFSSLVGTTAAAIGLRHPVMCNGANLSFRKEVFLEVNGYDDNLDIASGDDEFLMRKVYARHPDGIHFLNYYEGVITARSQASLHDLLNQRLRWAGKWKHNSDGYTRLLAVFVFVSQVAFLTMIARNFYHADTGVVLVALKIFLEGIFLFWVGRFLDRRFDLPAFLVLQLLYPLYVVTVATLSFFMPYHWKNRNYKQ